MKTAQEQFDAVQTILKDAIASLCYNKVKHDQHLSVVGLLGITIDKSDVFFVQLNETKQRLDDQFVQQVLDSSTDAQQGASECIYSRHNDSSCKTNSGKRTVKSARPKVKVKEKERPVPDVNERPEQIEYIVSDESNEHSGLARKRPRVDTDVDIQEVSTEDGVIPSQDVGGDDPHLTGSLVIEVEEGNREGQRPRLVEGNENLFTDYGIQIKEEPVSNDESDTEVTQGLEIQEYDAPVTCVPVKTELSSHTSPLHAQWPPGNIDLGTSGISYCEMPNTSLDLDSNALSGTSSAPMEHVEGGSGDIVWPTSLTSSTNPLATHTVTSETVSQARTKRGKKLRRGRALSNAERQRQFRQRRDSDPDRRHHFLLKERQRYHERKSAGKFKTVDAMTEEEKMEVRARWRAYKQSSRSKSQEHRPRSSRSSRSKKVLLKREEDDET